MRLYQLANARIMPNNKTLPKLSFLKEHSFILLCLPVGWGSTVYTALTMGLPGSGRGLFQAEEAVIMQRKHISQRRQKKPNHTSAFKPLITLCLLTLY